MFVLIVIIYCEAKNVNFDQEGPSKHGEKGSDRENRLIG